MVNALRHLTPGHATEELRKQIEMNAIAAAKAAAVASTQQSLAPPQAAPGPGVPPPAMGAAPDGLPPIPPPTPPGMGMGAPSAPPPPQQPPTGGALMGVGPPPAGGLPPGGPGAAANPAPGPGGVPAFAGGGVVGGAPIDAAHVLDAIARFAEGSGGPGGPEGGPGEPGPGMDMAGAGAGQPEEPAPPAGDPDVDALLARAHGQATVAPKRFTDYLDRLDPAGAEGITGDLAIAYHAQPDQAGVLWELVKLATDQGDEDVPPELRAIVRGVRGAGGSPQQAADRGRASLPPTAPPQTQTAKRRFTAAGLTPPKAA